MSASDERILIVKSGSQAGQRFTLDMGSHTLGRAAANQIVLQDRAVSKQHARLTVQPGGIIVEDLGSSNGTYLNGQRLRQAAPLKPGDVLRVGTTVELALGRPGAQVAELAPTHVPQQIIQPAASPFSLAVTAGPQAGQSFSLRPGDQILGRAPDSSLYIPGPTLSKQHARLTLQPDGLFIEDLNSANGTFVNGQRIIGRVQLRSGDSLRVGTTVTLAVQGPGGVGAARPAGPLLTQRRSTSLMVTAIAALLVGLTGAGLFFFGPFGAGQQAAATEVPTATPEPTATPLPAVAMQFRSDRDSVKLGECATLRWQVGNAKEVRLDGESVPDEGSRKVCPQEAEKKYRLTALSPAGETEEQTVVLVVPPTPAPPPGVEIDFEANQGVVEFGRCTTLQWSVQNAQAVRFEGEKVGPVGSEQVCPEASSTSYRLLVQPLEGDLLERTVIIEVPPTPTASPTPTSTPVPPTATRRPAPRNPVIDQFMADQYQLNPGTCTTLRWTVRNAGVVRIDGNQMANAGSMQACPPNPGSNTYNLVATGSGGGSVQSSVTLNVNQPTATPAPQQPNPYYQPPAAVPVAPVAPSGAPVVNVCASYEGSYCYVFRWNIHNVSEIYFDGEGVTGQGSKRVCSDGSDQPGDSGNLRIVHRDGRSETIRSWPGCN